MCQGKKPASAAGPRRVVPKMHLDELYKVEKLGQETPLPMFTTAKVGVQEHDKVMEKAKETAEQLFARSESTTVPINSHERAQETKEQKQKDFKAFVAEHQRAKYPSNKVHTTRFNIFNFLPITIGLQFSKVINVFYLGNAILQSFPSVSTNDPIFTIIPLTVLVCLGILKEGLADLKRYKIDRETNAAEVFKCTGRIKENFDKKLRKPKLNSSVGNIAFQDSPKTLTIEKQAEIKSKIALNKVASRSVNRVSNLTESENEDGFCPQYETKSCRTDELVVGDIIKVDDDQSVPADCFLLASMKGGKLSDDGSCFISTDSLDGERNLKPKMAIMEVQENLQEIISGGGKNILLEVNCKTEPKADLFAFEAVLKLVLPDRQLPFVDLDLKQFIPRGAYVRNSGTQYLMVLYTGVETKLIMNQGKYRYKKSKVDLLIDLTLFLQVCLMFSFSGLLVLGQYNFSRKRVKGSDYLFFEAPPLWEMASKTFGSFYLLNNSFVPMDMVSGIEIIKIYITKMFENDAEMVVIDSSKLYKSNPNVPITDQQINESMVGCSAQNLTIHEDLGQVDFIFCDKTGTLTQNELIFRQFKFPQRAQPLSENIRDTVQTEIVDDGFSEPKNTLFQFKDGYAAVSNQIEIHLLNHPEDEPELIKFFKTMCLCHDLTMVVNGAGRAVLNGPSQDELCLIQMAKDAGLVEFLDRDSSQLRIKVKGKIEVYKNLKFFDFTSDRKMMTRIVQNAETQEVTIMCKGADSSIFKRCLPVKDLRMLQSGNYGEDSAEIRAMYKKHFTTEEHYLVDSIDEFAKHGFRTLAFATRKLNSANIDDLTQEEIECQLTIAGVTSVEDLLQRDVAQCLRDFKEAGIKTWMLTGDKGDTARMIGLLCGMLSLDHQHHPNLNIAASQQQSQTMLVQINEGSEGDVVEEFTKLDKAIQLGNKLELMVSGLKLVKILACQEALDIVEKVLLQAKAVVIYRASPSQKADVVNFIKKRAKGKMTLAIGDGANDVNMIQSAHIGVGIKGKEGNQASMFADYSIPEFRGLRRLLFWHGRNFSQRLIDFILVCIYKNMSISICLSIYNMWAGFSGLQQCEQIYWMMFNSNMTLIALLGNFAFDQDIPFAWSAQDPYQQRIPGEPTRAEFIKDRSDVAVTDIKIHEEQDKAQMNIYELETQNIGFKITEYYTFHREFYQKKMMPRVFTFWFLAAYNGFVAFVVPCFGYGMGSSNSNGKMEDLFGKAFISLMTIIAAEHIIAYTRVRSWNACVGGIAIFAVLNILMDILLVEFMLGKEIMHRQLTEIMANVKFWLVFCIASLSMSAPLYIFKVFKMLIFRPIYFQK